MANRIQEKKKKEVCPFEVIQELVRQLESEEPKFQRKSECHSVATCLPFPSEYLLIAVTKQEADNPCKRPLLLPGS